MLIHAWMTKNNKYKSRGRCKMRLIIVGAVAAGTSAAAKDVITITYCNKGTTGNAAQNILLGKGFKKVYNLSGGQKQYGRTHNEK